MNCTDDEVADRVRKLMVDVLDLRLSPEEITPDIALYSPTIQLDSLNLLQLLVAVEEEFGCHIEDEDVMEVDLETVGDLLDLVLGQVRTGQVSEGQAPGPRTEGDA
ncbi:phosphopantetheine-binding protein [Streptomyces sp. ME19-01-6]|uniref:phosphopantetheine-binding protein n=1 Tax=Streptomyces sp. ME19-01-6 TaxID=3028686 RepID=UPI0029B92179|nr:phosphopantetheine-binding protein [Streptomyces sp. ME19-01-6]MDX3225477.1 phosphopantetheine-binding protein [Streptomyces sp. ME19-01-6]